MVDFSLPDTSVLLQHHHLGQPVISPGLGLGLSGLGTSMGAFGPLTTRVLGVLSEAKFNQGEFFTAARDPVTGEVRAQYKAIA